MRTLVYITLENRENLPKITKWGDWDEVIVISSDKYIEEIKKNIKSGNTNIYVDVEGPVGDPAVIAVAKEVESTFNGVVKFTGPLQIKLGKTSVCYDPNDGFDHYYYFFR